VAGKARGRTHAPLPYANAEIVDVVFVKNMLPFARRRRHHGKRISIPRRPMEIAPQLWLGPIPESLRADVVAACLPPGLNFNPVRHDSYLYGYFLTYKGNVSGSTYDFAPARELSRALMLSRLIQPNSASFQMAARVRKDRGEISIRPLESHGPGSNAWVAQPERDWITVGQARQLRRLLACHRSTVLPERVKSALFYFEYAFWMYYVDVRWTLLVTALESLVHVNNERLPAKTGRGKQRYAGSTKVFVDRLLQVQARIPGRRLGEATLRSIYSARSGLAHGQTYNHASKKNQRLYRSLEGLVRRILISAITDPQVTSLFTSRVAVTSSLPLRP
jgi:hypothetical protein